MPLNGFVTQTQENVDSAGEGDGNKIEKGVGVGCFILNFYEALSCNHFYLLKGSLNLLIWKCLGCVLIHFQVAESRKLKMRMLKITAFVQSIPHLARVSCRFQFERFPVMTGAENH